MASKNKYEILIDFLVELSLDNTKVNELAKKVQEGLKDISPDIEFDDDKIKSAINELANSFETVENAIKEIEKEVDKIDFDVADKSLEEFEKQLKGLENIDLDMLDKMLGDIPDEELKKLKDSLGGLFDDLPEELPIPEVPPELENDIKKLAAQFEATEKEIRQMLDTEKKALAQMKLDGQEGSEAYNKLEQEISQAEKELEKLNNASKQSDIAGPAEKATKSFGDRLATFGLAAQGIEQFTSTMSSFNEPFIELDKQIRNIGTLGVKNFEEFTDKAIDLSKTVPDEAGTIAGAIYDAIGAGAIKTVNGIADVAGGMTFVETASKLAVAGATTTGAAVQGLAATMNAYKAETAEVGEYSDVMFNIVNAGVTSVEQLNSQLSSVIPTASALGVPFKQVGAAIATMTKLGVPTASATTKINAALSELAKPGATLAPIMEKAGVSLESLKQEGLQVSLAKLGEEMKKEGKMAVQVFSSIEAAGAVMTLTGDNAQMAAEDLEFVSNTMGSTNDAFAIASEGIGNKTKVLMNNIQAGFNSVMNFLGPIGQNALSATTQVAPLITSLAGLTMIGPSIIPAVQGIGSLAAKIIGVLVPGLITQTVAQEGATVAQMKFNLAALANPYVAVAAALAGLIAAYMIFSETSLEAAEHVREEATSHREGIEAKIELNKQQQNLAQSNISLAKEYEILGSKANRSEAEQTRLLALHAKLAVSYKGVMGPIDDVKGNTEALRKEMGLTNMEAGKATSENQKLVREYEKLGNKTNKTKEENKRFKEIQIQLKQTFPGVIEGTNNFADALNALKLKAGMTSEQLLKLQEQSKQLGKDYQQAMVKESASIIVESREKINEVISDKFSDIFGNIGMNKGIFEKAKSEISKLTKDIGKITEEAELTQRKYQLDIALSGSQFDKFNSEEKKKIKEYYNTILEERRKQLAQYGKIKPEDGNQNLNLPNDPGGDDDKEKGITKEKKSQLELAKEAIQIANDQLDNDLARYENAFKQKLIEEKRDATATDNLMLENKKLEILEKQKSTVEEQLEQFGLINTTAGAIEINTKLKKADKNEVDKMLIDTSKEVIDQQKSLQDLQLKAKLDISEEELRKSLRELEKKQLEFNIKYGLAQKEDLLPLLEKELQETNQKIQKAQIQNDDKLATELKSNAIDIQTEINTVKEDIVQDGLDNIQEKYEEHSEKLSEIQTKQLDELKKFNEIWYSTTEALADEKLSKEIESIDKAEADKLAKYEEWKELGIISDKQFEAEKKRISDEANAERKEAEKQEAGRKLAREYEQKGLELEVTRKQELDKLNLTKASLEDQIAVYDAMTSPKTATQQKEYDRLKAEQEKTLQMMELYGTEFGAAAVEFGDIANQAMIEGIAGDPEALNKALKKTMGLLAGYLEQKISGFILSMVLSEGNVKYLSALPFPLNVAAIPLITSVTNAAVHKFAGPMLSKLTSFAGGGRYDVPTAVVGDAKNAGSPRNTEWVFRDADVMAYAMMAASMANVNVTSAIDRLDKRLAGLHIDFGINLGELRGALRVEEYLAVQGRR